MLIHGQTFNRESTLNQEIYRNLNKYIKVYESGSFLINDCKFIIKGQYFWRAADIRKNIYYT